MDTSDTPKSARGFAGMSPEKRREIARKGGKAVKPENRSFFRDRSLAQAAGCKGGSAVPPEKRAFSVDRDLASAAGEKGARGKPKDRV